MAGQVDNNNASTNNNSNSINDEYKSSNLILQYMYLEYTREIDRRKTIETRIAILITIATFFGGLFLIYNNVNFLELLKEGNRIVFLFIVLQAIACISWLASVILFLSLLISRPYSSIRTNGFLRKKPQGQPLGIVAYDLIKAYKECTDNNKKINDKKHIINNIGIILLIISVLFYVILIMLNLFIL